MAADQSPLSDFLFWQDGILVEQPDFSRHFVCKERPKIDPAAKAEKESYYRTRAAGAWPGYMIEGSGEYYFLSRCEGCAYLFARLEDMRVAKCGAGCMCDPIRGHERGRIKWQPPIKLGQWEKD